jgi:hypothetical protein
MTGVDEQHSVEAFSASERQRCTTQRARACADRQPQGDPFPDNAFERRIFDAYQEVKRARRDGDYAAICGWMSEVDKLLDRGAELNANAGRCTADG